MSPLPSQVPISLELGAGSEWFTSVGYQCSKIFSRSPLRGQKQHGGHHLAKYSMTEIHVQFNTTPAQVSDVIRVVLDPVGLQRQEPTIARVNGRPIPLAVPNAINLPKTPPAR
jgi:hypothetical protein